jgi:hypothetical protein
MNAFHLQEAVGYLEGVGLYYRSSGQSGEWKM